MYACIYDILKKFKAAFMHVDVIQLFPIFGC